MKRIVLILLTLGLINLVNAKPKSYNTTSIVNQEEELKITAKFQGYDKENDLYQFSYVDEYNEEVILGFNEVSEELIMQFKLGSEANIGKLFEVTYVEESTTIEEDGDTYESTKLSVVGLTLKK